MSREKKELWIENWILNSIKQKNSFLPKILKTKTYFYYERYNFFRDKLHYLITKNKKDPYSIFFPK